MVDYRSNRRVNGSANIFIVGRAQRADPLSRGQAPSAKLRARVLEHELDDLA